MSQSEIFFTCYCAFHLMYTYRLCMLSTYTTGIFNILLISTCYSTSVLSLYLVMFISISLESVSYSFFLYASFCVVESNIMPGNGYAFPSTKPLAWRTELILSQIKLSLRCVVALVYVPSVQHRVEIPLTIPCV